MTSQTTVYLRADGDSQIGLGHVHRLLAVSEILRPYYYCKFIIHKPLKGLRDLILEQCNEILELENADERKELDVLSGLLTGKEIVVLDGYKFETYYQKEIKKSGNKLVCIDDILNTHFVSDVIINPAGGIDPEQYSKEPYTIVHTGPRFAPLKGPFLLGNTEQKNEGNNSIFICMGGADPENHTLSTLKHCLALPFENYFVVIGEAYRHKQFLLQSLGPYVSKVNVLSNLNAKSLADTMKLCSTAVCSASGVAYEYSSVGGQLYIKQTVANQEMLYTYLLEEGLAHKLEDLPVDKQTAAASLCKQKEIFDGKSGRRILKIFNRLDLELHGFVRRAEISDLMTLFSWANDAELRSQSFNSNPITLESHSVWFNEKLDDPSCVLFIFEYKNCPVAQVRFNVGEGEAVISYSIDKLFRGRGWGEIILSWGIETFKRTYKDPIAIVGYVKFENETSNRIFKGLGFVQYQSQEYKNSFKYIKS